MLLGGIGKFALASCPKLQVALLGWGSLSCDQFIKYVFKALI